MKNKNIDKYIDKEQRKRLSRLFVFSVFCIFLGTMTLVGCVGYLLTALGVMEMEIGEVVSWYSLLIFLMSSIFIGIIGAIIVSRFVFRSVNIIEEGMSALASGNFDVRIDLGKNKDSKKLADKFNTLAEELENMQMLRSDFVNEYAHEFKTPIFSIKGFAELLRRDDLTEEQKKEYLSIIIEEAERLSMLSVNALNLSKIEKQSILTDVSAYNVSEQIRDCLLLLEKKWTDKKLEFAMDFDEYEIMANYELLKQVFINLLDNAVKFSDVGGTVEINLKEENGDLTAVIRNGGRKIKGEDRNRIFDKFYRADDGRDYEGNGIGLAIVKKIVDLHGGTIALGDNEEKTEFILKLPCARKLLN